MDAPFCKPCNKRHNGPCNTFFMANKVKPELVVHAEDTVVHKVVHSKHGKYADLEKRRAYRREWMRKRRKSHAEGI